jgi:hypothetical protein
LRAIDTPFFQVFPAIRKQVVATVERSSNCNYFPWRGMELKAWHDGRAGQFSNLSNAKHPLHFCLLPSKRYLHEIFGLLLTGSEPSLPLKHQLSYD